MTTDADPIIGNWYCNYEKGQRIQVVALDDSARTIEVQDFEGTLIEYDLDIWYQMNLDTCEAPLSWAGAGDIGTADDYGVDLSDTKCSDWNEAADEFISKPVNRIRTDGTETETDEN